MKKLCFVIILLFLIPSFSFAFTQQENEYIKKVKELSTPNQKLPQPLPGYGIVRNNDTGDIVILLRGKNQGKIIGTTSYGGRITAVYEK